MSKGDAEVVERVLCALLLCADAHEAHVSLVLRDFEDIEFLDLSAEFGLSGHGGLDSLDDVLANLVHGVPLWVRQALHCALRWQ